MKTTRRSALALIGAMAMGVAAAAPSVEITAVQQQYPWTNTVDITYEVQGVTNMEYFVRFTPTTSDDKEILDVNGEPSIQVALTNNGTYVAQWYPQTNLQYTACKMTPAIFRGGSGGGNDYMIVDLETWQVTYEPMATQEASNERYNTVEYKTRYLVLRRIAAGDDYRVGRSGYDRNPLRTVKISRPYYYTIFSLSKAQYERIANNNKTSTDISLKDYLSWNGLRGSALTLARPVTGVCGILSSKTGLRFDLPTVAMWEIAHRGGCTEDYLSGKTLTSEYSSNKAAVGSAKPNAWGIFDCNEGWWAISIDETYGLAEGNYPEDGLTPVLRSSGGQPMSGSVFCGTTMFSNLSSAARNAASASYACRLAVITE